MKRNTILSLIALSAAVAGIAAAVILFLQKKRCDLLTDIDDDFDDIEDEETLDFDDVLDTQEEESEETDCCADCAACGENCCEQEESETEKQNESVEG